MRIAALVLALALSLCAQQAPPPAPDPWAVVRPMVGKWTGEVEGQAGRGTVERGYEFVLKNRYLNERNISTYPAQEKNPKGEIHEHWTMFSYDRSRKTIVMRQFHQEGFVNQYALATPSAGAKQFLFESEGFENLPLNWRAREKYEFISADEFVETFELAAPGKEFEVYSRSHFKRAK